MDVDDIVTLLDICLNTTYLSFRGSFYQQSFSTTMGSPVSVTVANLVMEEIEEQALSTFAPLPQFGRGMLTMPAQHYHRIQSATSMNI